MRSRADYKNQIASACLEVRAGHGLRARARVAACTSSPSVRACMHATETVASIDRGIGDRAAC